MPENTVRRPSDGACPARPPADIEMPAISPAERPRLLVLLHGAGSGPGMLVPTALAWQLKLRSAPAVLLEGGFDAAGGEAGPDATADRARRRYWIDPREYPVTAESVRAQAARVHARIRAGQARLGLDTARTVVVGFSQGASIALELAFADLACAAIVVGFGARLYRLPTRTDHVPGVVHLVHGGLDSVVPVAHATAALRRFEGIGARATLDVVDEDGHAVAQSQINVATARVMQTLFGRRLAQRHGRLH